MQGSSHGTRGCSSSPRDDQDTAAVLNQEHGALGKCHERLNTPENALQATTVPGDRLGYKGCSAAGRVLGSILSAQPRHCTSLHCAVSCFVMAQTAALSVLMYVCVLGIKKGLPKVHRSDHSHCLSLSFPLSLFLPPPTHSFFLDHLSFATVERATAPSIQNVPWPAILTLVSADPSNQNPQTDPEVPWFGVCASTQSSSTTRRSALRASVPLEERLE